MPIVGRQGHDVESGQHYDGSENATQANMPVIATRELQIFGLKLRGLPSWTLYMILASMVFVLSLSAAYCAELVFVQAGSFDICTFTVSVR